MTAEATIMHFDVLFNSDYSDHSRILVCSTFAPFRFHDFSVQPCRQLCLFMKSSCTHLLILNEIQWPASLNCSSFPPPPQMCASPSLTSPSSSSITSKSFKPTNRISSLSYSSSFPSSSSSTSPPSSYQSTIISTSVIAQTFNCLVCFFWRLSCSFSLHFNHLLCSFPFLSPRNTAYIYHSISRLHWPPTNNPQIYHHLHLYRHHHHHHLFLLNRETCFN